VYDELGFPRDVNSNGEEVLREATISQEWLMRSKRLNHPRVEQQRRERLENIEMEKQRIEQAKIAKENDRNDNIRRIRNLLSHLVDEDHRLEEGTLQDCSIDHFKKLKADDLVDFIVAHDPNYSTKAQASKLKKGDKTVDWQATMEALENNTPADAFNTKILAAYRCRGLPCKFELSIATPAATERPNVVSPSPSVVEMNLRIDGDDYVKPSALLSNQRWIDLIFELFNVRRTVQNPFANICGEETKSKADLLVKILRGRLQKLMDKRNVHPDRRGHWAIKLANKNLSLVAAYMVFLDHVKEDLSRLDESKSLLTPCINRFSKLQSCNEEEKGSYLYYDTNNHEFIRSGKVSAKGFGERHREHLREARKEAIPESKFYLSYPTRENVRAKSTSTRGVFEQLTLYIAAGFDSKCSLAANIDKSFEEGGVMIMNATDKANINESMKQSPDSLNKFHAFLSYQMELGYDLAIAPSCNVSGSFGFESFVGLFQ
jgi:hypothetical protein